MGHLLRHATLLFVLTTLAGCGVASDLDWDAAALEQQGSPIVGGSPTQEFESVVLVAAGPHRCTGTVIAPDVVLTAAHCVDDFDGEVEVFWCDDCASGWSEDIQRTTDVHLYPHFNPDTMYGDLAVVMLPRAASTRPIPIDRGDPSPSWQAQDPPTFVGFGTTQAVTEDGGVKREVRIPLDEWDSAFLYYEDTHRQTCFGDSGGPALVQRGGDWTVAGVNSYGDDHCNEFGVSVRVDAFQDWIDAFTGDWQPEDGTPVQGAEDDEGVDQDQGSGFGAPATCSAAGAPTPRAGAAALFALMLVYTLMRRRTGSRVLRRGTLRVRSE